MTKISCTTERERLDHESYRTLHRKVLERDNWRCQHCGSMRNLHVHHIIFRSQMGSDADQNLITLCSTCHGKQHSRQ
jgi:5-methylcytosine-specific restriction endonuclease McrA